MRKTLLTMAAVIVAIAANAQGFKAQRFNGTLEKANAAVINTPQAKKAPRKVELASNQRLVGYYTTDSVNSALGLGSMTTEDIRPAVLLEPSDYQQFAGAKVVAVRFAMGPSSTAKAVTIYSVSSAGRMTQIATKDTTFASTSPSDYSSFDWNTVTLPADQQFTLSATDYAGLMVSYTVSQAQSTYPIGVNTDISGRDLYVYANISSSYGGSGRSWYSFGDSYGAPAIQLVLESDSFPTNGVMPNDFGSFTVAAGKTKNVNVTFANLGTSLNNLDYTVTVNGQTGDEQHLDLGSDALGVGGTYTAPIAFVAPDETGTYDVSVNVTKVNGVNNESSVTTANGTMIDLAKELKRGVVVEDFTGTTCGWCPRGIVGMDKAANAYPDNFVGVAVHQYTRQTSNDAMYNSSYANMFSGSAPSAIINRSGVEVDPYYGSGNSILDDIAAELENLPVLGVEVTGQYNADSTEVNATATIDPLVSGKYNIDFVLIADSIHSNTAGFRQYNYYNYQYGNYSSASQLPEDLQFLYNTGTVYSRSYVAYDATFNDVLISSSYSGTRNDATLDTLTAGSLANASFDLEMPTRTALKNQIHKDKVYVIAIVYDANGVANAAKAKVTAYVDPTGISTVNASSASDNTVVARYNAAGQRIASAQPGLNIVKYANGKTVKVIVK